jgi:hypothetical protein
MANDPQVAVRFAVKDAEVVRQALQNFGKDGEAALKKFDAAAKPIPKSLGAVSDVMSDLRGRASSLASSTGSIGSVLSALGPVGIAAAAGLGAIYLAFTKVSEGAKAFGQYAREVREFSEATGFSRTQVQALTDVFAQNGIEQEKTRNGLERLTAERANAAKGSGELYTELKRLNPALAEEFASSRSAADALVILTRALQQVDGPTQALISKFAFGKGGIAFAQALLDIAGKGGLGAVEDAAIKAGAAIQNSIIDQQAKAATVAEQKARVVERTWNSAYAEIYNRWRDFKKLIGLDESNTISITIAMNIRAAAEAASGLFKSSTSRMQQLLDERDKLAQQRVDAEGTPQSGFGATLRSVNDVLRFRRPGARDTIDLDRRIRENDLAIQQESARPMASARAAERSVAISDNTESDRQRAIDALTRTIGSEKERLGILGDVASTEDRIKLKTDETRLAIMQRKDITKAEGDLINEQFALQEAQRRQAIKSNLGLSDTLELQALKERELVQLLNTKQITQAQYNEALSRVPKLVKEQIDAQNARNSDFPALTKLGQDAGNLKAQLDTELSGALRGATSDILAMAKGTETASQGFINMAQKIADAVAQAFLMKTVIGPLAGGLSGGLASFFGTPGGAPVGAAATGVGAAPYAKGGVFEGLMSGLGRVIPFAKGGIIDRPTLFPMAKGYALTAEIGNEASLPLVRS